MRIQSVKKKAIPMDVLFKCLIFKLYKGLHECSYYTLRLSTKYFILVNMNTQAADNFIHAVTPVEAPHMAVPTNREKVKQLQNKIFLHYDIYFTYHRTYLGLFHMHT